MSRVIFPQKPPARFGCKRNLVLFLALAFLAATENPSWAGAVARAWSREVILLDDHWRFTKGDPTNANSQNLLYDVRPLSRGEDRRERLAEATAEAEKLAAPGQPVLKPWVLPTGNPFIKDPARHFLRPAGNPGSNAPYTQNDFDDRGWTVVDLPHDWAIAGPFNSGGVGGGMGRLPSAGVGWYRKSLAVSAGDAGKSIFLQVDGAMSCAEAWLNGQLVGGWPYGYASWQLDN